MKWSWKLGTIAGIKTYVHASFLLLLGWAAWVAYTGGGTVLSAILGMVFLLAVFGSVLLHELGHALVARRYGIQTHRIVLLPIGGVAQLAGEPRSPRQEFWVALAGPLVNFALAVGLTIVAAALGLSNFGLVHSLIVANLSLGLFNLVPAFPMDGGRVLRALLSARMGEGRATQVAVHVGKSLAIAFAIVGLFTNFMLVLIAAFVWIAATAEQRRVDSRDARPLLATEPIAVRRFWR
jgi:Zn-dependent protease